MRVSRRNVALIQRDILTLGIDFYDPDTVLHIMDKDTRSLLLSFRSPTNSPNTKRKRHALDQNEPPDTEQKQSRPVVKTAPLDLIALADEWEKEGNAVDEDPLTDSVYQGHKRAERQEKQARNTDKERAMHEKSELERLLGDLRGPDWLRTLGISGITETQKRDLEPKRDFFTARVQGLLERFASWKEREKELRLERERRLRRAEVQTCDEVEDSGKKLHSSAVPVMKSSAGTTATQSQSAKASPDPPPMNSFFRKRHQRAAAIEKHRRGRNVRAFGQPLPDMEVDDFRLPQDLLEQR